VDLWTLARRVRGAETLAAALILTGCGGGGGSSASAPPTTPPAAPTVTVSANLTSVEEGQFVQVTWASSNATSCEASGNWSGPLPLSGTETVGPLHVTMQFGVSCTGPGGTASGNTGPIQVVPAPSVTLTATPSILREGQTSQLTWNTRAVVSCEASGTWSGPRPLSGTETVGPFTHEGPTPYDLDCVNSAGSHTVRTVVVDSRIGPNQPPVANAGGDRSEGSGQRVELSAVASQDDHRIVSSSWTQVGGPSVTLRPGFTELNRSFTAPIVTTDTVLTFALTVTDDEGATSAPDTVAITILTAPPIVTLSGGVLYELVPHGPPGSGLNYAGQGFVGTADIVVEVLNATTHAVVASGTFPGDFHFDVPSGTDLQLRAIATMSRQSPDPLPHWLISVRDLDATGAPAGDVYSYTGPVFNSGIGTQQFLRIPSGWSTAGQLVGPRAAAPFAILDSLRPALLHAQSVALQPDLPELLIDWSPNNVGGETFFRANPGGIPFMVLSGEADVDTDEYDPAVIRHEFGHFIMHNVSRNDSIGGAHSIVERLDMRVALSEGFASAYGALISSDPTFLDSFGVGQSDSGFFDIRVDLLQSEGWFSESSVQEVLWSLQDLDGIWTVINGPVRDADAMVSPFVLFAAYRQLRPERAGTLDFLLQGEGIVGPTIDPYGSTESNSAGSANVLPVYTRIVPGGSVQVRSTNEFGVGNKLSTHRYLRLSVAATSNLRFRASAAAGRDPDMLVFHRGVSLGPDPGPANEDFTLVLQPGDYVLDVYDCGNADCNDNVTPGRVDITVSVTPN
jgi:hypothetical protein